MEYKKIHNLIYKQNLLIKPQNYCSKKEYNLTLDKMLINNLQKCIDKKIPKEIDEIEFANVYKIYLKLRKNNIPIDYSFIINLSNLATKKLDYLGIIHEITE